MIERENLMVFDQLVLAPDQSRTSTPPFGRTLEMVAGQACAIQHNIAYIPSQLGNSQMTWTIPRSRPVHCTEQQQAQNHQVDILSNRSGALSLGKQPAPILTICGAKLSILSFDSGRRLLEHSYIGRRIVALLQKHRKMGCHSGFELFTECG